jgi:hypothetical protein
MVCNGLTLNMQHILTVPGLEIREYGRRGCVTWHPLSTKVGTNFANKRRSIAWYSSLADLGTDCKLFELFGSTNKFTLSYGI